MKLVVFLKEIARYFIVVVFAFLVLIVAVFLFVLLIGSFRIQEQVWIPILKGF